MKPINYLYIALALLLAGFGWWIADAQDAKAELKETKTELTTGGRLDGKIWSKVLVVQEGALFFGQSNMDLDDAPGEADGSAYPQDELRTAYEDAARRGADWYRSRLYGPKAEPDHEREELDIPIMSEPDGTVAR